MSFDAVTPPSATNAEYESMHKPTMIHIDINQTLKVSQSREEGNNETQFFFPEALLTDEISDSLSYREYEEVEGVESKTGIYLNREDPPRAAYSWTSY